MNEHPEFKPGLQGDYDGSCVVCLRGTDTGLVLRGPEFAVATLMRMGVPKKEAMGTVSIGTENPIGMVPAGTVDIPVRVCAEDARKAGLEVGLLVSNQGVPAYEYEGD